MISRVIVIAIAGLAAFGAHAQDVPPATDLPLNPAVTQATIGDTICKEGWTKTVRPSYSISHEIKLEKLRAAGLTEADETRFELDHLIPIDLGGAVYSPNNLALEPWEEAKKKDAIEACLAAAVCSGMITLDAARQAIWDDWRGASRLCPN